MDAYRFCRMCEEAMWRLNGGWLCGHCDAGWNAPRPHWMDLDDQLCIACDFKGVHLVDGLCEGCAAESNRIAAEDQDG